MSQAIIYHTPRCSKSRATLALLQSQQLDTQIIKYLETPPSPQTLKKLLKMLDLSPRDILRTGEQEYTDFGMDNPDLSDDQLLQLMSANPKVIERPIVVYQDKAVLGRPPENVLELIA
ncbi:MAG: arsenate reductase (glutaredoxin) [Proteobacteria bacterium]|nr:MAG: arsenate reductase (glutaredoxin) [Pseudomonadota bacterium]